MLMMVVQIRIMPSGMDHHFMPMPVRMRRSGRNPGFVPVLVMLIMVMPMVMNKCLMDMPVLMVFSDVEPHPYCHGTTCRQQGS